MEARGAASSRRRVARSGMGDWRREMVSRTCSRVASANSEDMLHRGRSTSSAEDDTRNGGGGGLLEKR